MRLLSNRTASHLFVWEDAFKAMKMKFDTFLPRGCFYIFLACGGWNFGYRFFFNRRIL